jgi:arylsulfatase A-like enzyme
MAVNRSERHWWRAFGAAFVLAGGAAVMAGVIETCAAPAHTPLTIPDLLYGANVHLLLALATTLGLRILCWKNRDRSFPWVALGGLLVVELAVVVPYWLKQGSHVPPFGTMAGKLVLVAISLVGTLIALLLAFLVRRLWRGDRAARWALGTAGRAGIALAALLVIANALLAWWAVPRPAPDPIRSDATELERPNVFVILIDTLRRDHLSFYNYGRPTTPKIDNLFGESYVFTAAYTPSNWTVPSVASLFTGLYPTSHGVHGGYLSVPEKAFTLAEAFTAYGYRTAAFVDNPAISVRNEFGQGFATFFPSWEPWWARSGRTFIEWWARGRSRVRTRASWTRSFGSEVNDEFLSWVDRHADEPLFGYLHYMEPHHPYRPPAAQREAVAPNVPEGPDETPCFLEYAEGNQCRDWECIERPPELEQNELEGMIANYDGEIRLVDLLIGELLDGLRRRGLLEGGHLLFFSDHGEEFFDHRGWRHSYSIYEEMTGCVMAYRPPGGVSGGQTIDRPVGMLDLSRSLFDILGFEPPLLHQGRPIPEILGASAPLVDQPVLSELPPYLYSLRLRDWKLIRRGPIHDPEWRLYNLAEDPKERVNLAAVAPDTLAQLRSYFDGMIASLAQTSLGEREPVADPETLARLRALGYLR